MKMNLHKLRHSLSRVGHLLSSPPSSSAEWLELWLPHGWPGTAGRIRWRWQPADGQEQSGEVDSLADIPAPARSARARIWTSPIETILLRVSLPTRSRSKIVQALPYALEDQLLDPPETLQFSFQQTRDGDVAVAVTRRDRLNDWLSALRSAGIRPVCLAPLYLSLPVAERTWTVILTEHAVAWRSAEFIAAGCHRGTGCPAMLTRALHEAVAGDRAPDRLVVIYAPDNSNFESWSRELLVPVEPGEITSARLPATIPVLSLLQGEFAQRGEWREQVKPYLPAAALLLLWLGGGIIGNLMEWAGLQREHFSNRSEMKKVLLETFPETKTVLDPVLQMQRAVELLQARHGASGAGDFLPLLGKIAPVIPRDGRSRLQNLNYADKTVTLAMTLPDEASLETIKKSLAASRLDVEVQNVNRRDGVVEAKLRIRVSAAAAPVGKGAS